MSQLNKLFMDNYDVIIGAGSALLGQRGAMACTVAVEETITEHYNDQLRTLHEQQHKEEDALREVPSFFQLLKSFVCLGCFNFTWI